MRSIRLLALIAIAAPLQAKSPHSVIRQLGQHTLPAVHIAGEPFTGAPLAARLAYYHTPAVSVAAMDSGMIVWAKAWGLADLSGRAATPQTLFQAASISKPVAATAALSLVDEGRLSLDADVNQYLKSWQVPASNHAANRSPCAGCSPTPRGSPSTVSPGTPAPRSFPRQSRCCVAKATPGPW